MSLLSYVLDKLESDLAQERASRSRAILSTVVGFTLAAVSFAAVLLEPDFWGEWPLPMTLLGIVMILEGLAVSVFERASKLAAVLRAATILVLTAFVILALTIIV